MGWVLRTWCFEWSLHLQTHAHKVGFLAATAAGTGIWPESAGLTTFSRARRRLLEPRPGPCHRPGPARPSARRGSFGGARPSVLEDSEELTTWN